MFGSRLFLKAKTERWSRAIVLKYTQCNEAEGAKGTESRVRAENQTMSEVVTLLSDPFYFLYCALMFV